uniref:Eukaryotic translation initiation factor 2-alpha kinase 4 n=1 Tax=Schistocephalus solidus TaxID=70667 RepID=A0A0V0J283_SCHSO
MDGELELLRETFPEALSVEDLGHGHDISLVINPAVETKNVQVSIQLNIFCPVTYPSEAPTINLRNALGLSDIDVKELHNLLTNIVESSRGDLVLFPLIEVNF